jgi:hypothetical protein
MPRTNSTVARHPAITRPAHEDPLREQAIELAGLIRNFWIERGYPGIWVTVADEQKVGQYHRVFPIRSNLVAGLPPQPFPRNRRQTAASEP